MDERTEGMSEIKRYFRAYDGMEESLYGGWVKYSDHEAALAAARREVEELKAYIQTMVNIAADNRLDGYREMGEKCALLEEQKDELKAERERYRNALEGASKVIGMQNNGTFKAMCILDDALDDAKEGKGE